MWWNNKSLIDGITDNTPALKISMNRYHLFRIYLLSFLLFRYQMDQRTIFIQRNIQQDISVLLSRHLTSRLVCESG